MECYSEDKKKELAEKRRELKKAKRRIAEIDGLIQKLYEDNARGKLSDVRYATLSMAYEEEQQKLKAALPEMQTYLETETDKTENLQRFIDKVKQLTEIKELTPELIREFIDRIVVYAPTPAFTGLDDEALLSYMEDDIYYQLLQEIDTDQYYIQSVDAVYVSKEYLQERAYNSQSNVFFGYTLAEADHFIGYGSPAGVEHFL